MPIYMPVFHCATFTVICVLCCKSHITRSSYMSNRVIQTFLSSRTKPTPVQHNHCYTIIIITIIVIIMIISNAIRFSLSAPSFAIFMGERFYEVFFILLFRRRYNRYGRKDGIRGLACVNGGHCLPIANRYMEEIN